MLNKSVYRRAMQFGMLFLKKIKKIMPDVVCFERNKCLGYYFNKYNT